MNSCPCCGRQLLRHIRSAGVYWFCPNCRQEMPIWATDADPICQGKVWLYIPLDLKSKT
ncbi:MAG: hypothetical protein KME17_10115 [Cyanosarcina radialis HA8281-LM2]|nr:hypothetical protein [Cyanosarcina radialis HA8281-LM2]